MFQQQVNTPQPQQTFFTWAQPTHKACGLNHSSHTCTKLNGPFPCAKSCQETLRRLLPRKHTTTFQLGRRCDPSGKLKAVQNTALYNREPNKPNAPGAACLLSAHYAACTWHACAWGHLSRRLQPRACSKGPSSCPGPCCEGSRWQICQHELKRQAATDPRCQVGMDWMRLCPVWCVRLLLAKSQLRSLTAEPCNCSEYFSRCQKPLR